MTVSLSYSQRTTSICCGAWRRRFAQSIRCLKWALKRDRRVAGSFEGARRAALLYSLVQSCKLIDIPPFDYLTDVLIRIATHPQRLIGQLTPKGWANVFRRQAAE
jgi:hypothetical protein